MNDAKYAAKILAILATSMALAAILAIHLSPRQQAQALDPADNHDDTRTSCLEGSWDGTNWYPLHLLPEDPITNHQPLPDHLRRIWTSTRIWTQTISPFIPTGVGTNR